MKKAEERSQLSNVSDFIPLLTVLLKALLVQHGPKLNTTEKADPEMSADISYGLRNR